MYQKVVGRFLILVMLTLTGAAWAEIGEPEKDELTFGFIKLTDMAPIAIAYENGYFEDEGLYVTIEAQANWKVLLDGVIDGQLDGAHMLAGQPLAARPLIDALAPSTIVLARRNMGAHPPIAADFAALCRAHFSSI